MKLLLDTNILTRLCHPTHEENRPLSQWFEKTLGLSGPEVSICIPEIADYEVRRGLLHVALRSGRSMTRSLLRLDLLSDSLEYLPLNTQSMRRAAGLWAEARHAGQPTAPKEALDGDVILAAQALEVAGLVVTENTSHLSRFVLAYHWQEVPLKL
ncbi:MAG TPA: PIN domain-containing protein [Thermoanaerobaculia bacterium]|jgi:predicted nucleic acid-binding protein